MNASFLRRLLAYLVDMLILALIITGISFLLTNTNSQNIENLNLEINEVSQLYLENEISFNNYVYRYANISYQIDKMSIITTILNTLFIILLFIYIPFFTHGQTVGMLLSKIKIVKEDDERATLNDYLFRTILFYSLGHLLITLAVIYFIPSLAYFMISAFLIILEFLLVIISAFMVLYRHDKKGLHDIITRTKVIKI